MKKVILHCDMNNFFASVESLIDPSLKNKKMAVCGDRNERRGIVLAKNELAKKCGVTTAEPIWQALKKCPDLITVLPHYNYYSYFSQRAKDIYMRYTDFIEPFGIDECWLDVTDSVKLFGSGEEIAKQIRNTVRNELGLTISVGVSFNKIFAKLGSDIKKPDAVTIIGEEDYKEKIYKLPVGSLLGVGKSTQLTLECMGINTIGKLASIPLESVKKKLGKQGETIWKYANALDRSCVERHDFKRVIKSVSRGTTTPKDLKTDEEVKKIISSLSVAVARQLRREGLTAGCIQLSLKDNSLVIQDFQCSLSRDSNNAIFIADEAFKLFKKRYKWDKTIHSITVRVTNLLADDTTQLSLFYSAETFLKTKCVDEAVDDINLKFGKSSVLPMILLD